MAKFCVRPFDYLEITLAGAAVPCTPSWIIGGIGDLPERSLEQLWDSPEAQAVRGSIHDQSFRFCLRQRCPRLARLPEAATLPDPALRQAAATRQLIMGRPPRRLVLSYDPVHPVGWPAWIDGPVPPAGTDETRRLAMITDRVIAALQGWRDPRALLFSGPGEPLASPHLRRVLLHLAERPRGPLALDIQTSGQLLNATAWRPLAGLERYDLGIELTMDAAWPWAYEHLRPQGRWESLTAALGLLTELRQSGRVKRFTLSMTVQADNYHQMPLLVEMGQALGCDQVLFAPIPAAPALVRSFAARQVSDPAHAEHRALREVLRNPLFSTPFVDLGGLAGLRAAACREAGLGQLVESQYPQPAAEVYRTLAGMAAANQDPATLAAVAAAGLQRFPEDDGLWDWAARASQALGAPERAAILSRRAADARQPEA